MEFLRSYLQIFHLRHQGDVGAPTGGGHMRTGISVLLRAEQALVVALQPAAITHKCFQYGGTQ